MKKKNKKQKRMRVLGKKYEPMPIETFREEWLKKSYDLVDITQLCEFKLGQSGWCSGWNNPDENCYHIKVNYRDENIGVFHPPIKQLDWDDKYVVFVSDEDFIIFRKVKIEENK